MLTPIIAPTTKNLMAPETALLRLKLKSEDLDDLVEQVAEVSGLVTGYLRYEPAYGIWQEDFVDVRDAQLDLGARPAWSIVSVVGRAGVALPAESYRLIRGPLGESSIMGRGTWWTGSWAPGSAAWAAWEQEAFLIGGAGSVVQPDWTVRTQAGWWLEEMGDTPPSGVERLPPAITMDFLRLLRWRRASEVVIPGIHTMKLESASVEFSSPDRGLDPVGGLPISCTLALAMYRRPA